VFSSVTNQQTKVDFNTAMPVNSSFFFAD